MADPQVGQLYRAPNRPYPPAQQPNGIGTAVTDPTQPPVIYPNNVPPFFYAAGTNPTAFNERASMFTAGCAHCFRCWELIQDSVGGVPMMLVCCPLCGFIQNILTIDQALNVFQNPQIYG